MTRLEELWEDRVLNMTEGGRATGVDPDKSTAWLILCFRFEAEALTGCAAAARGAFLCQSLQIRMVYRQQGSHSHEQG